MSFTITARVDDSGQIVHGHGVELKKWLREHAGQMITATYDRKRKPRSHGQLEWLFGVAYPALAKEAGYDDHELHDKATLESIHEGLLQKRYGIRMDRVTGTTHAAERTTGKTAQEVSEFMEWVCRFSAEAYGLVLELPDERGQLTKVGA